MVDNENPDTLPTPSDNSGPCPWCGRVSTFDVGHSETLYWGKSGLAGMSFPAEQVTTLKCNGCKRNIVVVTKGNDTGIYWYPTPGAGNLDAEVNPAIASAYSEGVRCLNIQASRAAAVMLRSALSLFVKDKGNEKAKSERHLKSALKHMKDGGQLHSSLWDWADHLNQLGNEGAHPEDYDDVTVEEAQALASFVRQLITIEYEMPAQLKRAQDAALKAQGGATSE